MSIKARIRKLEAHAPEEMSYEQLLKTRLDDLTDEQLLRVMRGGSQGGFDFSKEDYGLSQEEQALYHRFEFDPRGKFSDEEHKVIHSILKKISEAPNED